ncbi:hypothetical protein [Sphingosinicella sp. BN140058]|uniref:hypothetical protein n=1 Tax=Sphingosinicella sp. BN140058 TaxID=1892855 RepID=UPI00101337B9|nr:hypothetical protein [Sphingosinicella sp. BN140058]QAY79327.1 hypothetical protein ETR14_24380 [Sphingosinicella sp. BN140058]
MSGEHEEEGPRTAGVCGRCSPTERNRYFRGKLLTVSDYQTEQSYMIGRRRLINRAMLGWGVVAGFELRHDEAVLTIGTGVALDRAGRELLACEPVRLEQARDLIWLGRGTCGYEAQPVPGEEQERSRQSRREDGGEGQAGEAPGGEGPLHLLRAHYAEVPVDGIRVDDGCGAATCEANHLCETVVYSLEPIDDCRSGLPGCPDGRTGCRHCDPGESEEKREDRQGDYDDGLPLLPQAGVHDRGPQERLCLWSEQRREALCIGEEERRDCHDPCRRDKLHKHGCLWVDLDAGIPLACVTVAVDPCGDPVIAGITDACRPRRLARPNEMLFDLIRGCDLTRIVDIGWREWHERADAVVPFAAFREMFQAPEGEPGDEVEPGPSLTRYWVETSGPVRVDSLSPDIFTIRVLHGDDDEGYHSVSRIMVDSVVHDGPHPGDPPDTTRRFAPAVSGYFYNGELQRGQRAKFRSEVIVEIALDGDRVIDAAGQCLDANRRGRSLPSGNGAPGGSFTSEFRVRPGPRGGESPAPVVEQGEAK